MNAGIISRIKQGFLAGESVPEPMLMRTCKNCSEKIRKDSFWGPKSNTCRKKRSQKARGI